MPLNSVEIKRLKRVIIILEKLIAESPKPKIGRPKLKVHKSVREGKRLRRTGRELVEFRKMLKAERKKGVSVAELSKRHGISTAYIYLMP